MQGSRTPHLLISNQPSRHVPLHAMTHAAAASAASSDACSVLSVRMDGAATRRPPALRRGAFPLPPAPPPASLLASE